MAEKKLQASVNIKNKKARFEFNIIDTYVCGIVLKGTEIKSIRLNKASITEGYCGFEKDELFLRNAHIAEYEKASFKTHEPTRPRKLLLNRNELDKIHKQVKVKGITIVPLRMFINDKGLAKLEIGIAEGKKLHDKRQDLKEKDAKREMDRAMKR
ncbi:SsrA-binding protein SmpB [Luteibaculum oceani]|uniref:SsrA-binding protein n=1 Tax=Luteibaculum oceani TaxID=1294296 RepID=A0A5C6VA65_9FLAO|nr:SsrA-binding protein SmpB [Luteibaculum oceani]TXC82167.1 SsrA-binding protein SmpB [Luteibaculum oceani]